MSGLFSSPSPPKVAPVEDKAIAEAAAEALRRRQQAKGFRSTILSQMTPPTPGLQQTLGS
jgi:hypothetical protein